ncbi:MAG TPA: HAMP domain-containing sensor histidine kinase [Gemmatimonadaceae bacterium]|nr:HAMP domain-containing sensor histidine kinase [Gemmatimonadaceae bacterium]
MPTPRFRTRLFLILAAFAFLPALVLTLAWSGMTARVLPRLSSVGAWDQVAASGEAAIRAAREAPASARTDSLLRRHEAELGESRVQARRFRFLVNRTAAVMFLFGLFVTVLLSYIASRVAGHLARQLSRPLDELVGWTDRIARGEALPAPGEEQTKGAPEFGTLRARMRAMAADLEAGRRSAIEAERLAAFRESARQVAHELKNPLTPIRFAVATLRNKVGPELRETVEVLEMESARLEAMAKNFAQFGRLPEGPVADVDLAELARETARSTLPQSVTQEVKTEGGPFVVRGQHDALQRALTNVLLNAVDATQGRGTVSLRIIGRNGQVTLAVRDDGVGIPEDTLARIWEPYVTTKTGGTGLGLAIVKQTVVSHGGGVEATSAPGDGTEIRMTIPAAAADAALEKA